MRLQSRGAVKHETAELYGVMALTNNLLFASTTLLLVYSDIILVSNAVNNTCIGKPLNWTETRFCTNMLSTCESSTCKSCADCQILYPGGLPTTVNYLCGRDNQLQLKMVDCPVSKCSYCLACNTSDLAILDTGYVNRVAVCKGCYLEDTIFFEYNTNFVGDVGACRVNVSCRLQSLSGNQEYRLSSGYYRPVLMSTPVCPRRISGVPKLDSVDPERGPVAGGTTLTITGTGLMNVARIVLGETKCDPLPFRSNNNDSHLLCQTSPAGAPGEVTLKVQTAVWPVTWINSITTFEFRPNPLVTDITEASTIASGGIKVSFRGQNLGSSESPVLLVTVICKATHEVVENFTEECESSDDETTLDCVTPDISDVSDNDSCDLSDNSATADSFNNSYRRFDFIMGLKFDGYVRYTSLSALPHFGKKAYLQVNNNVNIYRFSEDQLVKEFDPSHDNILIIRGDNMNRGAKISDYQVILGNGTSCVIRTLLSNQLSCRPPSEAPPIDQDNFSLFKGQKTVSVVVLVGNLDVAVGYLYYVPSLLSTILLATLLPGAAIIIAVVAAVLCMKRRKMGKPPEISGGGVFRGRKSFNLYFFNRDRPSQVRTTETELPQRLHVELASFIVLRSDIVLKEFLGQGQFGKIYRAVLQDKKIVAAKLLKDGSADVDVVAKFLEEAVLMKDFSHANVLGLCGVVLDVAQPIVLVELMEAGDLRTAIKRESFPLGDLINFCTQIANGMVYLSAQKFIHRDLAARNCLLDRSYRVKIGDFGLSHDLDAKDYYRGKDNTKPLPVKWMAPESLANGLFTTASDVWSYGVVMWEIMAKGCIPYADVNNYDIKRFLLSGRRLECPSGTPDALYTVMRLCWNAVPSRRPTFIKLLSLIDEFITAESVRRDLERRFTASIAQEPYSYATSLDIEHASSPVLQLNDSGYLEILENS